MDPLQGLGSFEAGLKSEILKLKIPEASIPAKQSSRSSVD